MSSADQDSLTAALSKCKIPAENHDFIRKLTNAIGIAGYRVRGDYIEAVRRDGGPPLHINWGYTNGFGSEDEAIRAAGRGVERAPSSRKGTWYVAHPLTKVRPGGPRSTDKRRIAGFCDCGMQLSVTGICGSCD